MNGFGSERRIMTDQGLRRGSPSRKPSLGSALLLIMTLALLPGASLSEPTAADPGEIKATTASDLGDTPSDADPNLIDAGTPAG